ncbi:hypothetical protein Agub_g8113, partial [Astrephomene gubernaculifera]
AAQQAIGHVMLPYTCMRYLSLPLLACQPQVRQRVLQLVLCSAGCPGTAAAADGTGRRRRPPPPSAVLQLSTMQAIQAALLPGFTSKFFGTLSPTGQPSLVPPARPASPPDAPDPPILPPSSGRGGPNTAGECDCSGVRGREGENDCSGVRGAEGENGGPVRPGGAGSPCSRGCGGAQWLRVGEVCSLRLQVYSNLPSPVTLTDLQLVLGNLQPPHPAPPPHAPQQPQPQQPQQQAAMQPYPSLRPSQGLPSAPQAALPPAQPPMQPQTSGSVLSCAPSLGHMSAAPLPQHPPLAGNPGTGPPSLSSLQLQPQQYPQQQPQQHRQQPPPRHHMQASFSHVQAQLQLAQQQQPLQGPPAQAPSWPQQPQHQRNASGGDTAAPSGGSSAQPSLQPSAAWRPTPGHGSTASLGRHAGGGSSDGYAGSQHGQESWSQPPPPIPQQHQPQQYSSYYYSTQHQHPQQQHYVPSGPPTLYTVPSTSSSIATSIAPQPPGSPSMHGAGPTSVSAGGFSRLSGAAQAHRALAAAGGLSSLGGGLGGSTAGGSNPNLSSTAAAAAAAAAMAAAGGGGGGGGSCGNLLEASGLGRRAPSWPESLSGASLPQGNLHPGAPTPVSNSGSGVFGSSPFANGGGGSASAAALAGRTGGGGGGADVSCGGGGPLSPGSARAGAGGGAGWAPGEDLACHHLVGLLHVQDPAPGSSRHSSKRTPQRPPPAGADEGGGGKGAACTTPLSSASGECSTTDPRCVVLHPGLTILTFRVAPTRPGLYFVRHLSASLGSYDLRIPLVPYQQLSADVRTLSGGGGCWGGGG